jgi:hypothetical protein
VDNCQPIYVGKDDLKKLLDLCQQVLKNKDNPAEVLPTAEGFFFDSKDYDEWYFEADFYYRASW